MHPDTLKGQSALVDEVLQRDHEVTLEDYLTRVRAEGLSYDAIARQLAELVDVKGFTVTYQWVRRWCKRLQIEEVSP